MRCHAAAVLEGAPHGNESHGWELDVDHIDRKRQLLHIETYHEHKSWVSWVMPATSFIDPNPLGSLGFDLVALTRSCLAPISAAPR